MYYLLFSVFFCTFTHIFLTASFFCYLICIYVLEELLCFVRIYMRTYIFSFFFLYFYTGNVSLLSRIMFFRKTFLFFSAFIYKNRIIVLSMYLYISAYNDIFSFLFFFFIRLYFCTVKRSFIQLYFYIGYLFFFLSCPPLYIDRLLCGGS